MINGDPREFVDGLYYGDERFFIYKGCKYFIQGFFEKEKPILEVYILDPANSDFRWQVVSEGKDYPVTEFEEAKIFDGKSFWEVENDIEWVDC